MISENKIKHSLGVARRCREIAVTLNMTEEEQDACFVMGLLHDIGYEKCDRIHTSIHPELSAEMIKNFIKHVDKLLPAIENHGHKYDNINIYDQLLNSADMTIGFDGNRCTVKERLDGIKHHKGKNSNHYKNALKQVNVLFGKGELDDD